MTEFKQVVLITHLQKHRPSNTDPYRLLATFKDFE